MNNQFDEPRERICSLEPGGQSAPLSRGELTKNLAQSVTRHGALKKSRVGLAGMALACFWLLNTAPAAGQTFTTFDYPGAVFTDGVDINRFGDIVGHYIDGRRHRPRVSVT